MTVLCSVYTLQEVHDRGSVLVLSSISQERIIQGSALHEFMRGCVLILGSVIVGECTTGVYEREYINTGQHIAGKEVSGLCFPGGE